MVQQHVLDACRHLLMPIARLLIRSGIGWAEFASVAKQVLVDVARQDHGLQGRPTNTARVALMTGLSRREVTRVRQLLNGTCRTVSPPSSRISQVLTGWHSDPDFQTADGKPAELPVEGDRVSLTALLNRYGGDTPHGALLKELKSLGLIVPGNTGFHVTAREYIRSVSDPDLLRQAGIALHDHAATIVHNVQAERKGPARFERMATREHLHPDDARAFRKLLNDRAQAFLEEMDEWLARRSVLGRSNPDRKPTRAGVGVYLIHDEE